ncbi:MAG: ATP-dependent helicase HrpB [Acidobacteriia bacterium]|nr:ATP-dependent helicase HrpB [Terriglobia bacterium]
MNPGLEALPIDGALPDIVAVLRSSGGLIVCAPPGAGKTTRVPRALHDAGFADAGEILILEPRRLAARLAAARVATEFGERLGETVGFSIRFENVAGPRTRIRFLTEGILTRRIVQDPLLTGVSVVIVDEFHERHLTTDLALAFLRRLQGGSRPDLKLLVMSATLDAAPIADFLGGVPVLTSEGTRFDVTLEYEERERQQALHEKVAEAASKLLKESLAGDVLVFLPGAAEIRLAAEACGRCAARSDLLVLPLHGDLPAAAQSRAVQPAPQRKLILATNVAETSVTIPGIAAVIDSGLARVAGYSAWSGLPVLSLSKVSKSSAIQRAGRAGRTQNGRVLRLYTRHDFECRPERDLPEIKRADLAESVLTLHGAGIRDIRSLSWFEPPAETALRAAEDLLVRLGALEAGGTLTAAGRQMLRFPLHPRLARLIVEGERRGVREESCLLAALLTERDIRLNERSNFIRTAPSRPARTTGPSDLLELCERFREAEEARFEPGCLSTLELDARAAEAVDRTRRQLCRFAGRAGSAAPAHDAEEALMIGILAAFPDRVARRRAPAAREFLLAAGGSGRLADTSVVHQAPLIVAVDAEERTGRKGSRDSSGVIIRLASAVEPEWLAVLFPDEISRQRSLTWNQHGGRVDELSRTLYGELALEETVRPAPSSEQASQMLLDNALARGLALFGDGERAAALQARIALLALHFPASSLHALDEVQLSTACRECCAGRRSLAELAQASIIDALLGQLTSRQRDLLVRETPERITLPGGRKVPVHYEPGGIPWIESALQDFVGMKSTPAICAGRVPLTVHLLAPNRRPVQVTQDLPGFWARHYPVLRRQLQRRYPKHFWPE